MVSLLFWLIFSILGVQLFSGKFQACVNHEGERVPASVVPNKTECLRFPEKYVWKNSEANFDNVLNGFLVLFLVVRMLLFILRAISHHNRRNWLTWYILVATQFRPRDNLFGRSQLWNLPQASVCMGVCTNRTTVTSQINHHIT